MEHQWARYGSLFVAAALFIGGAIKQEQSGAGAVFITAGLISFGAWLTLEIHFLMSDPTHHHPDKKDDQE